jgi:hypothetical protein
MGKRELLLVVCFVIVGAVVYQATAPPAPPSDRGLSFSKFVDNVRREIRGNRASAETTTTSVLPIDDVVTELRVVEMVHELHITGEDRPDIEARLRVNSNAYDEAEAKKFAEQTVLETDHAASSLVLQVKYPKGRDTGRQRTSLTLKVPSRLRVRVESRPGDMTIEGVAGVEAANAGGETKIRRIDGRAAITHRGGTLVVEQVPALKLVSRNAEVTLSAIRGDLSLNAEGGEVTAKDLAGPIEVDARNAEVELEGLEKTRGPIRVNTVHGSLRLEGVAADTRVDGRDASLEIVMGAAAPIAIYNEGDGIEVTPPRGGYALDALVTEGRIGPDELVAELGLKRATDSVTGETRASGPVNGGGPVITIRARRGDLTLRPIDSAVEDK